MKPSVVTLKTTHPAPSSSDFARLLGVAANNLDLVRRDRLVGPIHLKDNVSDQEGPHFIAEAVRVEAALLPVPRQLHPTDA